ncbi:MAG: protease inhibitor I42 family protein [Candidatus Methanomethylophilaceae archaeon]|nr:protease inhibitor I42 family protein [Candidatus Methanomethylophilaceae archaeon]
MSQMLMVVAAVAAVAVLAVAAIMLISNGTDSRGDSSMEPFVIELDANPTTGYSWTYYYSEGLHVESQYVPDPAGAGLCGAGGKQVMTLTADEPGTYHFKAEYKRPWEAGEPAQVYETDVTF